MPQVPYHRTQVNQREELESPAQAALRALLVGGASFIPQAAGALLSTSLQPGGTLGDALSSSASLQQRADKSSSEAALKRGQADYYAGVNPTAIKKSRTEARAKLEAQKLTNEGKMGVAGMEVAGRDRTTAMTAGASMYGADAGVAKTRRSPYRLTPEKAAAMGYERNAAGGGGGGPAGGPVTTQGINPSDVFLKLPGGKIVPMDMEAAFIRGDQAALGAILRATAGTQVGNIADQLATRDGRTAWWRDHTTPVVGIKQFDKAGNVKVFYQDIDRSQLSSIDPDAPGGPEDNRPGPTYPAGQPVRGPGNTIRTDSLPPQLNPPEVVDLRRDPGGDDSVDAAIAAAAAADPDSRDPQVVDLRGTRQPVRQVGFTEPTLQISPAEAGRQGLRARGLDVQVSEGEANRASRLAVAMARLQRSGDRATPAQQARIAAAMAKIRGGVSGETKGITASSRKRGGDAKSEGERELDAVLAEMEAPAPQGGGAPSQPAAAPSLWGGAQAAPVQQGAPAPAQAPPSPPPAGGGGGPTRDQTQAAISAGRRDANIRKWANHYGIPIPGE